MTKNVRLSLNRVYQHKNGARADSGTEKEKHLLPSMSIGKKYLNYENTYKSVTFV